MPYTDPHLPPEERAAQLISMMTTEEKAAQMLQLSYTGHSAAWAKKGIGSIINAYGRDVIETQRIAVEKTRLGIPILFSIDCIHGHALNSAATVFPSQLAMAQSFDPAALETCGRVSATEALCDGIRFVLSPILDIARDMRWCRVDETFGEDPYLAGVLGAAMVKGYQSAGGDPMPVICCPKHFVAHSESTGGRDSYEVSISDRKVKQCFMPAFEKAVEAGCGAVMSGQHIHDGRPMCVNERLINGFLKKDAGFGGFVITDNCSAHAMLEYGLAKTAAQGYYQAIMAGNDMLMFCKKDTDFADIAVKLAEEFPEFAARMDDAVRRILTVKFRIGLFENPYLQLDAALLCCDEHYAAALDITRCSITLLKNNNRILPLDTDHIKKIAVIGPAADSRYSQYGDWTYLNMPFSKNRHEDLTSRCVTYYQGIKQLADERKIKTVYARGCDFLDMDDSELAPAIEAAKGSDVILLCVGDMNRQNGEQHDRCHLELSGLQNRLFRELRALQIPIVVILSNGKPLCIGELQAEADAILECFNSGIAGGTAAAEILFGITNPSGKLPVSFPRSVGQLPVYYNYMDGWHGGKYIDEETDPLYTFGYGLSYTEFTYSDLTVLPAKNGVLPVEITVQNTGERSGTETVQLYVRFLTASYMQPVKNLKGFRRATLQPGEKQTVQFSIPFRELEIVQTDCSRVFEGGRFEIMAGGSSADSDLLKQTIELEAKFS